jgi:rSAM/selenodomain-associated transferase 1
MPIRDSALVIMTKAPVPGETKTRLVPPLSPQEAAQVSQALLEDQLQNLSRFEGADLVLTYTPSSAREFFARLHPKEASFAQRGGDLGERMAYAFRHLLGAGFRRVVLIGGDLPPVPYVFLRDAFAALSDDSCDVVLGPALDGGYYLIGMSRPLDDVFTGIEWSRSDVLAATLGKLELFNRPYKLVGSWYDVDTIDDLRRAQSQFAVAPPETMRKTRGLLKKFREGGTLN